MIGVIILAPRADQAYAAAMSFVVGTGLTAIFAAIIGFAVLPLTETFVGFSLAIGLVLVPAGAGVAQSWQTPMFTAMTAFFCFLLAPTNQMIYDTQQFYNAALATVAGLEASRRCHFACCHRFRRHSGPAGFWLLRVGILRRLARGSTPGSPDAWEGRVFSRLSVLPNAAEPLRRSQLVAALSVGSEIIRLRHICLGLDLGSQLDAALAAGARGDSAMAIGRLARLDEELAARPGVAALQARSGILAMSEALIEHAAYFGAAASG